MAPFFEPVTEETVELTLPSRLASIDEAAAAAADAARRFGLPEEALFGVELSVREAVPVEVGVAGSETELVITVRDRGEGFDPGRVADPTSEENLLKANGRGILFMRTFMDDVRWERHPEGGTVVRMTKKK